jgi:ABC-type uncharacterized transport system permease subunit
MSTNFWENLIITGVGILVSLLGFWTAFVKNMVTRKDVIEIMTTQSPYVADRQFIMERLSVNKENQTAFANALQRNTEVMNELKIQIATLGKTLEALEEKMESR